MLKYLALVACLIAGPCLAQGKTFELHVPDELAETGFLKHLLPRFSLKTGIRITVTDHPSDAGFGAQGTPVFRRGEAIWHLSRDNAPHVEAFEEWLLSDVGKRTIEAFAPTGEPMFSADVSVKVTVQTATLGGDAALGERLSLLHCGRCHVVSAKNRMQAIGSSPSFALLRTFPDWQDRVEGFYALKPHPAFTQVDEVTEPFPPDRPSPIAPIEVTLEDIDAITAYVGSVAPADLGAPLQSQ